MSIYRRISNLFSRSKMEQDIDEEIQSHLEMRVEDNIASGMSPQKARRDALLRFGNPTVMKERVAAADAALFLGDIWADVCRRAGSPLSPLFSGEGERRDRAIYSSLSSARDFVSVLWGLRPASSQHSF